MSKTPALRNADWEPHTPAQMKTPSIKPNPHAHPCHVGTRLLPYHVFFDKIISSVWGSAVWGSNSLRFSSSLGELPECLTGGERGLERSPWSSSWKLPVFYIIGRIMQFHLLPSCKIYLLYKSSNPFLSSINSRKRPLLIQVLKHSIAAN